MQYADSFLLEPTEDARQTKTLIITVRRSNNNNFDCKISITCAGWFDQFYFNGNLITTKVNYNAFEISCSLSTHACKYIEIHMYITYIYKLYI